MTPSNKCAALFLAFVAACGSDSDPTPGTASPDASLEGGSDAGGKDGVANDATSPDDAGVNDAASDTSSDTSVDAPLDAPSDAADAGDAADAADAADASDAAVDAGPLDCGDAGVTMLAPSSGFTAVSVYSQDAKLISPGSLVGDGNRRFWIQDPVGNNSSGDKVIDMSSTGVTTDRVLPGSTATCIVSQITRDTTGNAYVFDTLADVIYKTTPAGVTSSFSNVNSIGGGGSCTDSGVIGLLARADNSFFVGSPKDGKIYTLSADGNTRADFATVTAPLRLEHDGVNGLFVVSGEKIMAVSSSGVVTTRLDVGLPLLSLRRDTNGDLYFSSGTRLYRSAAATSTFQEVAACFPGNVTDIVFDHASNDAGAATSLYVLTLGANIAVHDTGDAIVELKR